MTNEELKKLAKLEVNSEWYKKCSKLQFGLLGLSLLTGGITAMATIPLMWGTMYAAFYAGENNEKKKLLQDVSLTSKELENYQSIKVAEVERQQEAIRNVCDFTVYLGVGILTGALVMASPYIAIVGATVIAAGAIMNTIGNSLGKNSTEGLAYTKKIDAPVANAANITLAA